MESSSTLDCGSTNCRRSMTLLRRLAFSVVLLTAFVPTEAISSLNRPLYEVLAVAHNATLDTIDEAYEGHAQMWSAEKQYHPAEIQKIIEIEHAYQVLSDSFRRRDYDYFKNDYLQVEADKIKKQYEGRTGPLYVEFPLWVPQVLGHTIESTAETISYENFGELVLYSLDTWLIQIYSVADPESHAFAPVWDRIVDLTEGVVKVGRLELSEMPLALILAERNWLHGYAFYRDGFPAFLAVTPDCRSLKCIKRYNGEKSSEAIVDWVASRVLKLPRILYYTPQTLMSDIIQKPGPHKVKVLQFSATGERASLYLRRAARDYREYAVFAMILWRESEATLWESRIGVESGPATGFLKDPGLPPIIYHGKLSASTFVDLMEQHKTFGASDIRFHRECPDLPQLRSITAENLGCDVSRPSRAGYETKIWYCIIAAGRPGLELNQLRGVVRGVQEQLTISANEDILSSSPGVQAFKDKRLALAWLDGELQKAFCFFYLNSPSMYETCGPRKYDFVDIAKIFLIRYLKIEPEKESESPKKRWWPKTRWEEEAEEEAKHAAQLVTRYNGSADVTEITEWISTMVEQGDNDELPFFRGKAPDLIAEEIVPLTETTKEFLNDKRETLFEKGKGVSHAWQDFAKDPKFLPLVVFIALFYTGACYLSSRQKKKLADDQVSTEVTASEVPEAVSTDSSPTEDSMIGEGSSEHKPSLTSEGLRKREIFQSSG